jgi:hypothetical protein
MVKAIVTGVTQPDAIIVVCYIVCREGIAGGGIERDTKKVVHYVVSRNNVAGRVIEHDTAPVDLWRRKPDHGVDGVPVVCYVVSKYSVVDGSLEPDAKIDSCRYVVLKDRIVGGGNEVDAIFIVCYYAVSRNDVIEGRSKHNAVTVVRYAVPKDCVFRTIAVDAIQPVCCDVAAT